MFLFAFIINAFVGGTLAAIAGLPPVAGAIGLNVVGAVMPLGGGLHATVYTEIWTGETIKAFRTSIESIGWLNRIRSYDQYAENDVIHFVNIGGDPTVLINNTTYPLAIENLTDADKVVSLDKYQTKPTRVTDDEIYALSYDKMASVIERHRDVVDETKYRKALHSLAPASNATLTPVVLTSGANSDDGTRKKITTADIIALKKQFDIQKIPLTERILVLCPDHVQDLLLEDREFAQQYNNYTTGKIANMYSFEIYEYVDCPYYTVANKTKLAYGAIPDTGTDRMASIAYYARRMMRATGSTKSYLSEAKTNPENQQNLYNLRHYFICLPLKNEALAAIVSNVVAS